MKKLRRHSGFLNQERSQNYLPSMKASSKVSLRFLACLFVVIVCTLNSTLRAQEIQFKPESIKVYTDNKTISIEARKDIDYLELWDLSKSKRRMKFKPNKQSIKVNTQRLRKSDYQIVLFFGNDTKLIKFTI